MLGRSFVLGIAAVLSSCMHAPPPSQDTSDDPVNSFEEHFVDIDGHAMKARTYGLAARKPGEPVIVFENGSLSPLESWASIPERASAMAPVILYDRATVGGSEWDGEIATPSHVRERLGKLLDAMDAPPPYILVGWSWGGDLIRYHAAGWYDEVVGLVYVDPAAHSPSAELELMEKLGFGKEGLDRKIAFLTKQAEVEMSDKQSADITFIDRLLAEGLEHDYGSVPPVPMVVLVAGSRKTPTVTQLEEMSGLPVGLAEEHQALLPGKLDRLHEWVRASNDGLLIYSQSATHYMQGDEPELVLSAIERVVGASKVSRQGEGQREGS